MTNNRRPDRRDGTVHTGSPGEQVLAHARAGREIIQDFSPLADSLEWQLGQEYLRQRGNKAFLSDSAPVPFVVNNDGALSQNAADVFFAGLLAAEADGTLEDEIVVLELGIGVGLFARYFLDHVRALSRQHKKDYYERLTYIAADRSPRMLQDLLRHGVLAEHPGRYRVRQVDALQPEILLRDVAFGPVGPASRAGPDASGVGRGDAREIRGGDATGVRLGSPDLPAIRRGDATGVRLGSPDLPRLRAVFLNYLLDCLPAAVLELDGDPVRQLCVRTCVARNVRLADYTDLTAEQLRQRARTLAPAAGDAAPAHGHVLAPPPTQTAEADPATAARARQEMLEVYGLFASEYDYRPVATAALPYGDFAVEYGRRMTKRLLHSYGAIQCLEKLLGMLVDGGFILVNDYGQTQITRDDEFEHQRFSLATFVGVNFSLLREYFGEGKRCQYVEPAGEEGRGIHARLLAPKLAHQVFERFYERFGEAAHHALQEPIQKARACVKAGRFEFAADCYDDAIRLQPRNWVLLCEVSQFLTFSMGKPERGADMAKVALALNPSCSAELWNALGDALFAWGRTGEARSAYEKALGVNAADVRARYNLAWVHAREREYPQALARIAEALALDKTGEYRERLLQKQQEVVALQARRHQQEYLLLINLVSKFARPEKEREHPV